MTRHTCEDCRKPIQGDMARIAGVNPSYLSQVERGRSEPSSEWAARLAIALGTWLAERREVLASGLCLT
jgi:transcriptional regulator with XRE-family HTH domain